MDNPVIVGFFWVMYAMLSFITYALLSFNVAGEKPMQRLFLAVFWFIPWVVLVVLILYWIWEGFTYGK